MGEIRLTPPLQSGVAVIAGQRFWQALAGAVTMLLFTTQLGLVEQGWYYTFVSVAAIYSIFEMGLSIVVLQITAHNFLHLEWSLTGVFGEKSAKFASYVARSARIYLITAGLFFLVVYPIGIYLFSERAATLAHPLSWAAPWTVLVFFTSLGIFALSILEVVEGSGDIAEAYAVRLVQGVAGSIACWVLVWSNAALWATTMMGLAIVCVVLAWLRIRRRNLWLLVREHWSSDHFNWVKELCLLQWSVGSGWISVFSWPQLATPIVFFYQGPIEAGQIGLSLSVAHMVGIFAQSWIARGVPYMSQAVSRRDWEQLRSIFSYYLKRALMVFGGGTIVVLILWLLLSNTAYIERVLPSEAFLALFLFVLFYLLNGAFASQLRSYKKEPLLWVFLLGGMLSLLGTWFAAQYSVVAVAYITLLVKLVVVFPMSYRTWRLKNRVWQLEPQL